MVLDGIGGHRAGEVASTLGLNTIKEIVTQYVTEKKIKITPDDYQTESQEAYFLNKSLTIANQVINVAAHSKPEYHGMGTTVASLLMGKKTIAIAHVGDSRIYLIRNNSIERLTEDHSLVMEQLKLGIISEKEAEKSEMKNIITRALGADEVLIPTVNELTPFNNDLFLICSDGLTDLVSDEEIFDIILKNKGILDRTTQALIDKANKKGGKDNITTILINIKIRSKIKLLQWFFSILSWAFENISSRFNLKRLTKKEKGDIKNL